MRTFPVDQPRCRRGQLDLRIEQMQFRDPSEAVQEPSRRERGNRAREPKDDGRLRIQPVELPFLGQAVNLNLGAENLQRRDRHGCPSYP